MIPWIKLLAEINYFQLVYDSCVFKMIMKLEVLNCLSGLLDYQCRKLVYVGCMRHLLQRSRPLICH